MKYLITILFTFLTLSSYAQVDAKIDKLVIGNSEINLKSIPYSVTGSFNKETIKLTTHKQFPSFATITSSYYLASSPLVVYKSSIEASNGTNLSYTLTSPIIKFKPLTDKLIVTLTIDYANGLYECITILVNITNTYASTPLPVTLTKFSGSKINELVYLSWTTSSEVNVSHFELEKSNDGSKWNKVNDILPGLYTYKYVDGYNEGYSYYRLKVVDNDNSTTYSPVIVITNDKLLYTYYVNSTGQFITNPSGYYIEVKEYQSGKVIVTKIVK